jgi:16S rRNA (cytidine1402-2'-O)-methyltransferase
LNTDPASLRRAAADAAAAQQYPAAALYLVATPIGNLADLTLRAIHVLGLVDAVACEDTRVSGDLLRRLGIAKPLIALHQHNEAQAADAVIERLAAGQRVACVSDAGAPAISDPGARLVARVVRAGHRVLPIPGPSSVTAALGVAGDEHAQGFRFVGFLPARGAARARAIAALAEPATSQVLFEAPHRIERLADELASSLPGRDLTLCRELTKQFETVHHGPAAALAAWLAEDEQRRRGEFVLVLHAVPPAAVEPDALDATSARTLEVLLAELPLKQAVSLAAQISGAPRNALYGRALALRGERSEQG